MKSAARNQSSEVNMATFGLAAGVATLVSDRQLSTNLLPERFKTKINFVEDCWLWNSEINLGYAMYYIPSGHTRSKRIRAHRWVYEQFYGKIEKGLVIDHLCRKKNCVNPNHAIKTHCKRGHRFVGRNLRIYIRNGKRHRSCRRCFNTLQRNYSKEKRYIKG